jgi:DNA-directed RNA polymerase subunit H (RpoH/RPB5)
MSAINPLLLPVKKDSNTVRLTVLENLVNMLNKRKWILDKNVKSIVKHLMDSVNEDNIYKIPLDVDLTSLETYLPNLDDKDKRKINEMDGKYIVVKLLPQNITSIAKSPIMTEFITSNVKYHKIIVVSEITEKVKTVLMDVNKNLELFKEIFLMIDLLEHVCSPKYEILTPIEIKEIILSYHTPKKKFQIMLENDPASIYLFLQKGQIVRIIRNSEITGTSIAYKIIGSKKN